MDTIIGVIAKPLGLLLSWLYDLTGVYGIALIILTLIVKLCLYPLYAKQIKSTAGMSKIQPKMKALQQKYANDKETLNIKMAELYKEEKFNPMAGCLPMVIQMPIIFGLFALLRNPLNYISNDNMLFGIHQSFLWMVDLSQPDKWILPIAAGIATFISFSMTQQQQAGVAAAGGTGGMMKMMKYIFPVMIVMMGRSFPAGLAIYWCLGQVVQIFFNLRMNVIRKRILEEGGKKK
ncbi:MAG: YidC/Oxa1 family membrane protein insertase [Eubacteriaceae bacterium]|nr:YidC/Oxa1 family membrane protein insertase [Eubacteriaceae bacterium]